MAIVVPIERIHPNPWNPNVQVEWMFKKELASIKKFGFVDPITVREKIETMTPELDGKRLTQHKIVTDLWYEIIDGEHRWKGAVELGYTELPCWNLGIVDDATAQQMTIVLNETRGEANQDRLRSLLQDLAARNEDQTELREVMPFSRERFNELLAKTQVDWQSLEERRKSLKKTEGRWKEIVFRMPYESATVIESAIEQVQQREEIAEPWRALEMICADYLAGPQS